MIVSCKNCKKRYRINSQKLKSKKSTFKCTRCGHIINVYKPPGDHPVEASSPPYEGKDYEKRLREAVLKRLSAPESSGNETFTANSKNGRNFFTNIFSSLWGNMILFFFLIPLATVIISGALSFWRIEGLTAFIEKESDRVGTALATDKIERICRAVAVQAGLYLRSHPKLHRDQFMKNPVFKGIAVQEVGTGNYTMLYQMPDSKGALRLWSHKNPAYVARDLRTISKDLSIAIAGDNFRQFIKILMGVSGLKESKGNYQAKDADGNIRKKYLVCTPIEGTPYVIAVDVFMDEFKLPVQQFGQQIRKKTYATRNVIFISLLTAMLASGTVVFIYSKRLTRTVCELTKAADRISIGDFGNRIEINREDEIGDLAHAISRLQESTRLFLKRADNRQRN